MFLEPLIHDVTKALSELGFSPLDPGGGERHGAWEWTWLRARNGKRHAYVTLAALESLLGSFDVQIWAGADNGTHFARHLVRQLAPIQEVQLADDHTRAKLLSALLNVVEIAAERAMWIPDASLTETYPRAGSSYSSRG